MIILINHFIIFLKLLKDLMRNDEEGDVDQIIGGSTVPKWQHNYMVPNKSSLIVLCCV
jgi:hypothetical protein